jgi:hypothetical protein
MILTRKYESENVSLKMNNWQEKRRGVSHIICSETMSNDESKVM